MSDGRLLLLMSLETYRASDFLAAAEKLALDVVVGTEKALAFSKGSEGLYLSLPFHDNERAVARARAYAERYPLRAVVVVDDEAVVVGAAIASALGLPGNPIAAAGRTRDKAEARRALAAAGLAHPRFWTFTSARELAERAEELAYPCVLKPRALSASRGVIRADDPDEARSAAQRIFALLEEDDAARRTGASAKGVIVEAYLPGDELAVEALLDDGKLEVLALFDKPDPLEGPYFEETLYVTPSRRSADEQRAVTTCVRQAAEALGLIDGPVHAEVRLHEGKATLVEVAARTIGGLCGRTLRFGTGMSLEEVVLRHAAGMSLLHAERERRAAGVMMLPIPRAGVLARVDGLEEARRIPGVEAVTITAPLGRPVVPLPEGRHYLGFAFARSDAPAQVEAALRAAHQHLRFVIEG